MPTTAGTLGSPLNPAQTQKKLEGLITVLDDTDETESAEPETATPAPPPPEASPQTSDTEPTAEESADDPTFEIDGEMVPLSELKKSRLRQDDYTRKTTALAEERKTLEAKLRQDLERDVGAQQSQYVEGLKTLRETLEQLNGEPDWAEERAKLTDAEFLKRRADWEASKAQLQRLKAHEQEEREKLQATQVKQYQDFLRGEQDKLIAAVPEWADADKRSAEQPKLVAAGKLYGFSEQELKSVVDHRAILLLRDAMRYKELAREPKVPEKVKSKIKAASPGTPNRPRPNERQNQLIERAAKTGRGLDAMKAIESILPDD